MPSAKDLREFRGFLRNATDRQVQGIYDKERRAGRDDYSELAVAEAERRGIALDQIGHSTMKTDRYDVIESKVWKRDDGATASPYGASPWTSAAEEKRWKLITRGYTVRDNERGTVGIGRQPWATRAEAQAWVDKETARRTELATARESTKKTPAQLQREIDEVLKPRRVAVSVARTVDRPLVDAIHAGCRVTIVDRFGKQRTGRAVMRGPAGWVLNMGGSHGTPAIASDANVVAVRCSKRSHATMKSGATRKQKDRTHLLRDYVITSPFGKRTWQAEDAAHAREQHLDAFPDDPDERILSVRLAHLKKNR